MENSITGYYFIFLILIKFKIYKMEEKTTNNDEETYRQKNA